MNQDDEGPRTPILKRDEVPQADDLGRVVLRVKHALNRTEPRRSFPEDRDRQYYTQAAYILGLLDEDDQPTAPARELSGYDADRKIPLLASQFAASRCSAEWIRHSRVQSLDQLEPSSAEVFLQQCTALSGITLDRRISTLRSWLLIFQGKEELIVPPPGPPRRGRKTSERQMRLEDLPFEPDDAPPETRWPDPMRFPHNEGGASVGGILDQDLAVAGDLLIVVGYASMDRVIDVLAQRYSTGVAGEVRVVFGQEPFNPRAQWTAGYGDQLPNDIIKYWLERRISPWRSAAIIRAKTLVDNGGVRIRTGRRSRRLHAKIYATPQAVTIGSSNFTVPGLREQSEGNARFDATEPARRDEARLLAEGLWDSGRPFDDGFLDLLDKLLKPAKWQEALARGCAAVLEDEWARAYVPADELGALQRPLWPHQLQGLTEALWILETVGSVLVADATGSGKTRLGAWLVRGAYDRQYQRGQVRRQLPSILVSPGVASYWKDDLQEAAIRIQVDSHGVLSNTACESFGRTVQAIEETQLLAVDEAHRFVNPSARTRRLVSHYADQTMLFTATPINRGEHDLVAIIELLGADNLPDEALARFARIRRILLGGQGSPSKELEQLKLDIRRFMVRRTRKQLNAIVEAFPDAYRRDDRRLPVYPEYESRFYMLPSVREDIATAQKIVQLAKQIRGAARTPDELRLPQSLRELGWNEIRFLRQMLKSMPSLAAHMILDCLRSSRAALEEHMFGTDVAYKRFDLGEGKKDPTGDVLARHDVVEKRGKPRWGFHAVPKAEEYRWLWDEEDFRRACAEDRAIYEQIGSLGRTLTGSREDAKVAHLTGLASRQDVVLAFDSHLISLDFLRRELGTIRQEAAVFSGREGKRGRTLADEIAGPDSPPRSFVMLCSDALSEGLNLQGSRCVVHLDTPTVIRTAEQRGGRVDRMNSRHAKIEIWWPKDASGFAPRNRELLKERHLVVSRLIGSNMVLPPEGDPDEEVDIEKYAHAARPDVVANAAPVLHDAFRAVRSFIGDGGLISTAEYDAMRPIKARFAIRVTVLRSESEWGFFVVGERDGTAPRWLYLDSPSASPIVDFDEIEPKLRARLGERAQSLPIDIAAAEVIRRLSQQLDRSERLLLPQRRQRALDVAVEVIEYYRSVAWDSGRESDARALDAVLEGIKPDWHALHPDPGMVAERWLGLLRPLIRDTPARRKRHRRPWTIRDLVPILKESPLPIDQIVATFRDVPNVLPLGDRMIVCIVGVPAESERV